MVMPLRLACLLLLFLLACKEKKIKLPTDENLSVAEFIELSPVLSFPVVINDSLLNAKQGDSSLLKLAVIQTFLPDTVFKRYYPQTKQLKLYLLGKTPDGEKGNYVFIKSVNGAKKAVHFFYFTKKNQFLGSMKLADNTPKPGIIKYCRIDSRFNISQVQERKTPTGEYWNSETIYYMDATGKIITSVTNSNEDLSDVIMGNPIDTLPRKNKYSGDYRTDKKNLVSVRDGATPKTFEFFIHFSKQNGTCVGELKGTGEWAGNGKGIFSDNGSDCLINFSFTGSTVSIKEVNGCGSYRDITCFFEGSFTKVKEPAKPKKKK
jgi:hypothetical protein